jgi:hypothetical protein
MPYTVVLPGGMGQYDHEAYVRVMNQQGVDRGHSLRTLEPQTGARWLPVWNEEDAAERFTAALRKHDKNNAWRVQEVAPEQMSEGPLGPLDIYVGCQGDGFVYELDWNSRKLLQLVFPRAHLVRSVMIGTEAKEPFEQSQPEVIDRVALILTGLTPEQLCCLGGYHVYDPVREKVLWSALGQPGISAQREARPTSCCDTLADLPRHK